MAGREPRKVDHARWRTSIIEHLRDFPRQYAALDNAMAAFGNDFDLAGFKPAFETREDMDAYNRVQALERAVLRVQNYVGQLAEDGVRLAGGARPAARARGYGVERAFEALREAGVVNARLCQRLVRAQAARRRIEDGYVRISAGDVHRATLLVHDAARDFIARYRRWIEPYLGGDGEAPSGED